EDISRIAFPVYDDKYTVDDMVTVVIQVNGRLRSQIEVMRGTAEAAVREAALKDERTQKFIENKQIVKTIYVKDKLINIVVR
ncbi:MAG: leucine--tRNA ligase, partial [Myxococcota bacterium]